ncbi:MAG: VOC family protein [Bacteroidales bacterium]
MNLKIHSSVIFVRDINISKQFYCDQLKQEIEYDFGNNVLLKCGITLWQIPHWHYLHNNFYSAKSGNKAFEICFETDQMDDALLLIKNNKIPLQHDIIEEKWGQRTIRMLDPDNNLIEIGEKLEVFINRLHEKGFNSNQIAQKTGVPEQQIKNIIS